MRRTATVLALVAGLTLAACGSDDDTAGSAASSSDAPADLSKVKLRVGVQKDGIRAVLERTGALKDAPYQVEFSTFQFGPPLVEAAGADKIDLAWVGSTPPIFGAAAGSDFKIIAAVKERDAQENSILVPEDSPIQKVEDLEGKRVAVPKGSSAHGLLLNALNRSGLSAKDVTPVFLAPADGLAAFSAGKVDAWTVWDPFTIQAQEKLGARAITGGEPDEAGLGFEIASSKALEDDAKRAAIADYVKRLKGAWEWAGENPDAWGDAWSKDSGLPASVTRKAARLKASDIVPLDGQIIDRQQKLADLLREEQVLPSEVDFESIVDRDVVQLGTDGMPVTLHWFLPTTGDSRSDLSHGDAVGRRPGQEADPTQRVADVAYLGQVARAAEQSGFEAALTPISSWCPDPWVLTAALTQHTERLKFLVAFRPSFLSPTLAAQMAATYQRISGGRLLLNIVVGGDDVEQRRFGDHLSKDERYAQAGEFLEVFRRAWQGETDFAGEHIRVEGAHVPDAPPPPQIYLGGSSPAALEVAARHVDVYLTWGEPPGQVAEKLDRVRAAAERAGRTLRFGIRLHVITRDTSAEAWAEADRLLAGLDPAAIERAQAKLASSQSEGQQRMVALHGGRTDQLEVSPNLWAGVGLVRGGAGTALVGSHEEVADRIAEYHDLGIDEFVLSGYPHLEEAYRAGEGLVPVLRERGLLESPGGRAVAAAL